MARKSKKGKNTVRIDFSQTESGGILPESDARLKVLSVEHKDNDGDGTLIWKWEITGCSNKALVGRVFSDRTSLSDGSLWNLRNRLEALQVEIPSEPQDLDLDDLADRELEAHIGSREWQDRTYINLTDYLPVGVDSESDDEDEEVEVTDRKRGKKEEPTSKRKGKKVEDEDDEDEDESPKSKRKGKKVVEEDDEEEEEEKPARSKRKSKVEDDEDEEEDEDEDEKPKSKKNSKAADQYSEDDVREMDPKGLASLVKKHKLDVDLDDYSTNRKKAMAVIDALEEEGLLEQE